MEIQGNLIWFIRCFNCHTGSTDEDTEKFRITSDGNVGIGSSVPQYALDISDGAISGIRLGVGAI